VIVHDNNNDIQLRSNDSYDEAIQLLEESDREILMFSCFNNHMFHRNQ